jgi:hypothetical protein
MLRAGPHAGAAFKAQAALGHGGKAIPHLKDMHGACGDAGSAAVAQGRVNLKNCYFGGCRHDFSLIFPYLV